MPIDIYQAVTSQYADNEYYRPPLSSEYVMVGPGVVVPTSNNRMNGLGKRKPVLSPEEEEEKQTQVYLSAPARITKGKRGKGLYLAGQGLRLAGEGNRLDQSGGAARILRVASKLLHKAYPAVFRGLGAALHHRSMYKLMHGRGMRGSGKVGAWFRKAGQTVKGAVKGALKSAGQWAKEKIWQPLLERAKKLFGDFIREKLKQYIPDSEAGIQAKADQLLDKAFGWIASKLPPGWSQAASAAFEVLRGPLRELASSAIKKGFDLLHKASAKTGVNMDFDKPEKTEEAPSAAAEAEPSSSSTKDEELEVPDGESSGKGYGGHMFGGRKISSAQLSALVRSHAMNKFNREPRHLDAFASY